MADELKALEKHIAKEYGQASKELQKKYEAYMEGFKERYKHEYEAYQNGAYTKQEFIQWQYNQLGRGKDWKALKEQMATRMTESTVIASKHINGALPTAYANASNMISKLAQRSAMDQGVTGIRFDLVDESTVRNLMLNKDNVISFKTVSVNPVRDYNWNASRIQNSLLQGILQGDDLKGMVNRFMDVIQNNRNSAIRNARTAITSARSAGKQDRFDDLAEQGCEITKIWVATEDERTRASHMEADGQEVPYNKPFFVYSVELGTEEKMMYPCDSNGSPANVYNCRCAVQMGEIRFHSILTNEQREKANIKVVG